MITRKNRKDNIASIEKKAMLDKVAQEATESVDNSIAPTDDYGHKIFEELLKRVKIKGFEDLD
jgi:hypothetical protein